MCHTCRISFTWIRKCSKSLAWFELGFATPLKRQIKISDLAIKQEYSSCQFYIISHNFAPFKILKQLLNDSQQTKCILNFLIGLLLWEWKTFPPFGLCPNRWTIAMCRIRWRTSFFFSRLFKLYGFWSSCILQNPADVVPHPDVVRLLYRKYLVLYFLLFWQCLHTVCNVGLLKFLTMWKEELKNRCTLVRLITVA